MNSINPSSLAASIAHYRLAEGASLLERTEGFFAWKDVRSADGVWPYSRSLESAPTPQCNLRDDRGLLSSGINFATQDYLNLSSHRSVLEAAIAAAEEFGVHSAGSPVLAGNTRLSLVLEDALAELVRMEHVVLFPTGWAAGYGAVTGLVRPSDHIVIDRLAHNCLQEGAKAATPRLHFFEHNDVGDLRALLRATRAGDPEHGILVVTESLFSMDSDCPDLRAVQDVSREFRATLLVDVAHDLGAMGPGGGGIMAEQEMLGQADLVMGSFSKTFASNGGFLATNSRAVKEYVKFNAGPLTFSNALSPIQAAVVNRCVEIVRSAEGELLRAKLGENVRQLRQAFKGHKIHCLGRPSPIVPVPVGEDRIGRVASSLLVGRGVFANLVEFPAVAVGSARFRMQVMANHTQEDAHTAAGIVSAAIEQARSYCDVARTANAAGPQGSVESLTRPYQLQGRNCASSTLPGDEPGPENPQ
jgi:glycine C-acetyltransferase